MLLHNLATNPERIKRYQALCLPSPEECPSENFENTRPIGKLCYTADSKELCGLLKERGIKCADHNDWAIENAEHSKRAALVPDYLYLGALWILSNVAIPTIIQLVIGMLKKKEEPNIQINIQNNFIFFEDGKAVVEPFEGDLEKFKEDLTAVGSRIDEI